MPSYTGYSNILRFVFVPQGPRSTLRSVVKYGPYKTKARVSEGIVNVGYQIGDPKPRGARPTISLLNF